MQKIWTLHITGVTLLSNHIWNLPQNWIDFNIVAIIVEMGRATWTRRPPNREPTSLAGAALIAGASGKNEAIDTIETVTPDSNIDPALTTYEIDHPPPPSQSFDTLDPIYDPYSSNDL